MLLVFNLVFTGQAHRHVRRVPDGVGRMLWVYTWTTVGDAVMDLALGAINEMEDAGTQLFGALNLAQQHLESVINDIDEFRAVMSPLFRDAPVTRRKEKAPNAANVQG